MLLFGECEETETKQTLASNKELHLLKLFAPFKDKSGGWHIGTVREQAILYLNCLGYGHGGKSLADTKSKKAEKPDCFSPKLDFGQYEHPSKASLQSNEFLIEGILNFLATMSSPIANFPPLLQRSPKNPKKKKKEHVERDSKFMVESEKTKDTFYTCDMLSGYCSCPVGSTCAPCKHKSAIAKHFKIALFSVAPVSDPKMKAMYLFFALGKVLPAN